MLKAFKKGQDKPDADIEDSPVRLWIAGEIDDYTANAEKTSQVKTWDVKDAKE